VRPIDGHDDVGKFDLATGMQFKSKVRPIAPSLTAIFANALIDIATEDRSVVGITAAMPLWRRRTLHETAGHDPPPETHRKPLRARSISEFTSSFF